MSNPNLPGIVVFGAASWGAGTLCLFAGYRRNDYRGRDVEAPAARPSGQPPEQPLASLGLYSIVVVEKMKICWLEEDLSNRAASAGPSKILPENPPSLNGYFSVHPGLHSASN
jgi:hypothetical protein